jgi:formylglycine-generating enzyme required for sulfatase activity
MELQDLCMGCMAENGGAAVCPQCGFAESQVTTGGGLYLPPRTVLNERYVIGRVLGQGGFGIIYLAFDVTLNLKLAIKEFLPRELAARGADGVSVSVYQDQARQLFAYGLEQFLAEARTLARLSEHPGIVMVRDFFVANGTGYLAMSYLDGLTLKDYVARKGGRLPFLAGFRALLPVMDALREVHALGLLHRDISPDNIYLTRDKQVKLIDFGAARVALGERSKSLSVIFKPGFAPEEQYRSKGNQGPWTDVYALAGTLYYAITGHVPPEALDRLAEDTLLPPSALGVDIPPAAEAVLLKALAVRATGRYPTVDVFQQELMRTAVNRKEEAPAPVVQPQWGQSVIPVARPVKLVAKPKKNSFENEFLLAVAIIGFAGLVAVILPLIPIPAPPSTPIPASLPTPILAPPRLSFEPKMVGIVGGCFQMGSPQQEDGRDSDEQQHPVCLREFEIGKYEVTQRQWQAVMGGNLSFLSSFSSLISRLSCPDCPVEQVSWNAVQDYLRKLNLQTGKNYRLPTEAEWEYACRGGVEGQRYCGGDSPDRLAWYDENSGSKTHPVGQKAANGFGLYDMTGNVWEWTCSAYDKDYGGAEKVCINNSTGGHLSVRGGGWFNIPARVRSAFRGGNNPAFRTYDQGFRLAGSL